MKSTFRTVTAVRGLPRTASLCIIVQVRGVHNLVIITAISLLPVVAIANLSVARSLACYTPQTGLALDMAKGSPFATFLIIGPTCFFLGILFASFPYDYYVLWSTPPAGVVPPAPSPFPEITAASNASMLRQPYLNLLEHHLRYLHQSPPLISRILHIAIATGITGLLAKLYKPTEANMLFDGASLVLYMVGVTVYITNLVKGMRVVTQGTYGQPGADLTASRFKGDNERIAKEAEEAAKAGTRVQYIGREDSLKVLAASNTILALVLVGILVLQAGQWYAYKKETAEIAEMDRVATLKKNEREKGGSGNAVSSGVSPEAAGNRGQGGRKRQ